MADSGTLNVTNADIKTYCAVHPDRETALRCNRCNRLMCTECAVSTPVGYRCRECVRGQDDKFFTATPADDAIAGVVTAGLTAIVGALVAYFNLPLLVSIIFGLPAGAAIAGVALRLITRKRSRNAPVIAGLAAGGGGLVGGALAVAVRYSGLISQQAARLGVRGADIPPIRLETIASGVFNDIGLLIAVGLIAVAVYQRFKMRG